MVVATAVGYAVLATVAPLLRRRRRRGARGNRERVVGAWLDALDSFEHVGVPVPRASTPTEIVAHGMAVVGVGGREPLGGLADLATAALFAPDPVSTADADIAWHYGKELRAHLRKAIPIGRRARCRLAPRPVLRHIESRHIESRHIESRHIESRHIESRHIESRHIGRPAR
jgi:hypothetical protein